MLSTPAPSSPTGKPRQYASRKAIIVAIDRWVPRIYWACSPVFRRSCFNLWPRYPPSFVEKVPELFVGSRDPRTCNKDADRMKALLTEMGFKVDDELRDEKATRCVSLFLAHTNIGLFAPL